MNKETRVQYGENRPKCTKHTIPNLENKAQNPKEQTGK